MADVLTIRRGVNFDVYFDSYTDDTNTQRIDYTGWRFVLSLRPHQSANPDIVWATDDTNPALTVVAASNPSGQRLAFHLNAAQTKALANDGRLTLLQIDPADPTNVSELTDSIPVNLADAP